MSDSDSEYDGIEVGLTSVLLGFPGKEAVRDDLSVLGNHIGGTPVWYGSERSPVYPPAELLKCKVCDKLLDLLAQLSCPLPDKYYDRSIYVMSCADPNCRRKKGSIRAIRGINNSQEVQERISEELSESRVENSLVPETKLGDSLFSTPASNNPFAAGSIAPVAGEPSKSSETPQHKSATKMKLPNKRLMRTVPGRYTCKLVEVEEEYLDDLYKPLGENVKIEELETEAEAEDLPTDASAPVTSDNSDEPSNIKDFESNSDPVFTHFIDIVESNPDQVLRYEVGLKPLLYSGTDAVAEELPNLAKTANKRLEVQLMPHLIGELETEDMLLDGMEWGSIFVACDVDDKMPPLDENGIGYVEEWVGVQWE